MSATLPVMKFMTTTRENHNLEEMEAVCEGQGIFHILSFQGILNITQVGIHTKNSGNDL